MQLRPTLRKATELGIGLTVIATLILAGCGGGTSASGGGGAAAAMTTANVTPFKGPFYSGAAVSLKDANGNPISLISGGTSNASGVASVTYSSNVTYPLIVEVTGNYYNENTGLAETASVPLRGLINNAGAAANVPVTIVTETAVADLQARLGGFAAAHPIRAASAVAALSVAGTMLGVPASAVPAFTAPNQTSDANTLRLAAWAVVANSQATGTTLADKVKALANSFATMNPASAPTAVISQATFDAALTSMTSGASSVMAAGTSVPTPPIIPIANYGALYASAVAAANSSIYSYTLTTTRTSSGITQSGITMGNVAKPQSLAEFCADQTVNAALNQTIGFMGTLQRSGCLYNGISGRIDVMIDLGIGAGYTTSGSVTFIYSQGGTTTGSGGTTGGTSSNPGITGVTPSTAAAGSWVVINGTNFTQTASSYRVSFNGATSIPIVRTLTQLGVYVPNGGASGPLTVTDITTNQTYAVTGGFTVQGTTGVGQVVSSVTGAGPMAGTWAYTSPGGLAWSQVTDGTVPNAGAVYQASLITHLQSTSAESTVTLAAAGTVSFYYKVSSEANYDFLKFFIDGVQIGGWSGAVPWTLATFPLTAGTHTLRWTYIKDGSLSSGSDTTWISQVAVITGATGGTPAATTPTITGMVPSSGYPGDYVTLTGTGFNQATSAYTFSFNGMPATQVLRNLSGELAAQIPVGATTGAVTVTDTISAQVYTAPGSVTVWNGAFMPIPVGGVFTDVLNDAAIDFVDMGGATLTIDAINVTFDLTLRNLPASLNFNQASVPLNFLEYEWAVDFDTNNDGVKDYTLSASHYKLSATPVAGPLLSNIQADVWSSAGSSLAFPTSSLIGTTGLRLTVPIAANPALANITTATKVRFHTFHRNGAATSVGDSM